MKFAKKLSPFYEFIYYHLNDSDNWMVTKTLSLSLSFPTLSTPHSFERQKSQLNSFNIIQQIV